MTLNHKMSRTYSVQEGVCPFLIHISTSRLQNFRVCSLDQKLRVLVLFLKSRGLKTNQSCGSRIFKMGGVVFCAVFFRAYFPWRVFSVGVNFIFAPRQSMASSFFVLYQNLAHFYTESQHCSFLCRVRA